MRKFAENNQAHKQAHKQTENSITEATLIPCGSSGRAGQYTLFGGKTTVKERICKKKTTLKYKGGQRGVVEDQTFIIF